MLDATSNGRHVICPHLTILEAAVMANMALKKHMTQRQVMTKTSQKWLYLAPAVRSCHTWRKALPPVALSWSSRLGMSCKNMKDSQVCMRRLSTARQGLRGLSGIGQRLLYGWRMSCGKRGHLDLNKVCLYVP